MRSEAMSRRERSPKEGREGALEVRFFVFFNLFHLLHSSTSSTSFFKSIAALSTAAKRGREELSKNSPPQPIISPSQTAPALRK